MFTGIVQARGRVVRLEHKAKGCRLAIETPFGDLQLGESIAVDGVCLTVDEIRAEVFSADASAETLARTTLGELGPQGQVHLERALRPIDRLGGHIVTGHVDAVAKVLRVAPVGEAQEVEIELPAELRPFFAEKGSVTLAGVSLTVNAVGPRSFAVTLIPRTLAETGFAALKLGAKVNLEVDVLARYVVSALRPGGPASEEGLARALRGLYGGAQDD